MWRLSQKFGPEKTMSWKREMGGEGGQKLRGSLTVLVAHIY